MSATKLSKAEAFPYRLHINPSRYFSIIRFPNEAHILNHLTLFRTTLPAHEFFSLTSTHAEISVIQDATHPLYPQALGQDLARLLQIQTGFVLIQVVPDTGSQIDFVVTGLLARLASILARENVPIFAISTFDTDYILLKEENLSKAIEGFDGDGINVMLTGTEEL